MLTLPRRWLALIGVSLATFMTFLDNNVVNVALPSIQRDLGLSISALEWVVSSYILVFAGLMLVGGRLADLFGRRRMFLSGLAVFTFASLLAGLAGDETMLIGARVLQGVGAAAAIPPTLAIIAGLFPDESERTKAVGVWSAIGALALALGPFTGGVISQHMDWGWIFLINVPFGIATFALTALTLDETRDQVRPRLDLPGLVTSTVALFAITYALIEGQGKGWTSTVILSCFALGAVALAAFIIVEMRSADPMVDMSMFRSRVFSGGVVTMMLWGFGVMGIYFFTAMYLQNVLALSPTMAGAAFIPMALSMVAISPIAPIAARRLGTNVTVALGVTGIVGALLDISTVGEGGRFIDLVLPFVAFGVGSGLLMAPLNTAVMGQMPAASAGAAGAVINASREISALLGVTVVGAILTTRAAASAHDGAAPLTAFLDGYRFAIIIAAAIVAVGIPIALLTLRPNRHAAPQVIVEEPIAVPL
ncbi:DHA2 family efflux MFS transporter permease subunit [Nocardia sp. NPDC056100]|uniref:DHA2 family efflux MFS transporter permease subunit n=1 Tax=Nocardia sp. NPDC056100 TaxID=3345712 RepID=UPI0035E16F95